MEPNIKLAERLELAAKIARNGLPFQMKMAEETDSGYIDVTTGFVADYTGRNDWNLYEIRIKPNPVKVPLGQMDWIWGGPWWVRKIGHDNIAAVIAIEKEGTIHLKGNIWDKDEVMEHMERSNDGKTWLPCWKEAVAP